MAGVLAGCGGMWQGLGYLVGGQAYGMDSDMWWGWWHVVGYGGLWQGVGECGRGAGRVWGHLAGGGGMWLGVRPMSWMGICGRGGDMW